jgi:hypothetical protein
MTLDASGNLGVGTTSPDPVGLNVRKTSSTGLPGFAMTNDASVVNYLFTGGSAAATTRWRNNLVIYTGGAQDILFETNSTERARIDSSGNLGLGVTPSAWSGYTGLQVKATVVGGIGTSDNALFGSNVFYDGSNFKYINTTTATLYRQLAASHAWYIAPSGTAGNAISFTQAMTLDASGNLGIGTTTADYRLVINGTADTRLGIRVGDTLVGALQATASEFKMFSSGASVPITFQTNGVERARITSGGDFQFNSGYGSVATAYGCRAWVNFNGAANSNLSGTYLRVSPSTTVTVTITAHGLKTGDLVFLDFTSGTGVDGEYTATVIDANTFTVTTVASTTTSGNVTLVRSTIRASGNVSSVSDNGTGDYTVNFTTAMPDANFAAVALATQTPPAALNGALVLQRQSLVSGSVNFTASDATSQVAVDAGVFDLAIFR